MWELDHKESWAPKNWCFWTVVLEKTLESPLDCKEIQPVHPKRDQSWVFIGGTDGEAETPVLWPPDAESWLFWKDPDAGKAWGQEKETTEDEMVGWHHWHNGYGFWWTPGVGDGQGGLTCCGSWGRKELDTTEQLTEKEMATHSSVLAWRIPGMGDPGGLPSLGSHRVRHDWSDLVAAEQLNWTVPIYFQVYPVHIHLLPAKVLIDAHGTIIWLPASTPVSFKCYVDIILNCVYSSPNKPYFIKPLYLFLMFFILPGHLFPVLSTRVTITHPSNCCLKCLFCQASVDFS